MFTNHPSKLIQRDARARTWQIEHEVVFLENFFDYLRQRAPVGK